MSFAPAVLTHTLTHTDTHTHTHTNNSESLVNTNSDPDFKPFFFCSTNEHLRSHPSFDSQLDPDSHPDTHCIKVSLIDINSDSDVKPYVFCSCMKHGRGDP